ncbi:uncharacterized protein [Watersipora subatra]|uniref:uncharacterized protein n=1 Tax=Watersipora subatra TaxID=2589382 RepID=UPI00355B2CC7
MWDFILYNCAVATFIFLFWFHKPKVEEPTQVTPSKKSATVGADGTVKGRSDDTVDGFNKSSFRSKSRQQLTSFKRRKDLVEHDIVVSLGLNPDEKGFEAFCDRFSTFEYVSSALVQAGFCSCDVIVGIDFTASNEWQGKRSFCSANLHKTNGSKIYNPYQKVLHILGKTLSFINSDHVIHSYGFGDSSTKGHSIFSLHPDGSPFSNYGQLINAYTETAKSVTLDGPSNFAPIINKAVQLCQRTGKYHVLIIIMDGQVSAVCEQETIDAIVRASDHPLSIIAIGIGDGPFGIMFEYDDGLPRRKFDNLQFVNFHRTVTKSKHEAAFALHALMEIPDQYKAIQQLGYIHSNSSSKSS